MTLNPSPKAIEFLHALQATSFRKLGKEPKKASVESTRNIYERLKERTEALHGHGVEDESIAELKSEIAGHAKRHLQLIESGQIGPYESPETFEIINQRSAEIRLGAKVLGLQIKHEPAIGTLPTGNVNANILLVEGLEEETVVLLDDGILPFANLMAKPVVECIPYQHTTAYGSSVFSTDVEDLISHVKMVVQQPNLEGEKLNPLVRFDALVLAYVYGGDPHMAEQYFIDPRLHPLQSALVDAFELFVIGHEYAHSILGHLPAPERQSVSRGLHGVEGLAGIRYKWRQELEADQLGLELSSAALLAKGQDIKSLGLGPLLFFKAIEMIEEAVAIAHEGSVEAAKKRIALRYDLHNNNNASSHPPPSLRLHHLRQTICRMLPAEHVSAITRTQQIFEVILSLMSEFALAHIAEEESEHRDGYKLAEKWKWGI